MPIGRSDRPIDFKHSLGTVSGNSGFFSEVDKTAGSLSKRRQLSPGSIDTDRDAHALIFTIGHAIHSGRIQSETILQDRGSPLGRAPGKRGIDLNRADRSGIRWTETALKGGSLEYTAALCWLCSC